MKENKRLKGEENEYVNGKKKIVIMIFWMKPFGQIYRFHLITIFNIFYLKHLLNKKYVKKYTKIGVYCTWVLLDRRQFLKQVGQSALEFAYVKLQYPMEQAKNKSKKIVTIKGKFWIYWHV